MISTSGPTTGASADPLEGEVGEVAVDHAARDVAQAASRGTASG